MLVDCIFDYFFIFCNMDEDDNLYQLLVYGVVVVDMGFLGEGSVIVKVGNFYGFFGGNSVVILYVIGVIVLLYVSFCEGLEEVVFLNFVEIVFFVKEMIV